MRKSPSLFYQNNKLISYSEVKARVAYLKAAPVESDSSNLESLSVEIPPHSKATDAALASRLAELQALAKTKGREIYVYWEMAGREE